jgi:hypothetical protein
MTILMSTPGKIEYAQSPLSEISRQLGQIGGSGKLATRLTAAPVDLHLEVRRVGRIRFPVTPRAARKLIRVARPARHGFKDETRLDPRVRDTWEIAKSSISIDQSRWMETLAPQLDRIRRHLGLPDGCHLRAQLHDTRIFSHFSGV